MYMTIFVLIGPTSTGKSGLAMELAKRSNSAILSCDSRQIYDHADVGTNKLPLPNEAIELLEKKRGAWIVNGITIHGYDVFPLDHRSNVADFIAYATPVLQSMLQANKMPLLVGGTGFFVDALLGKRPYSLVAPNYDVREALASQSSDAVWKEFNRLDPIGSSQLNSSDRNNKQRLIRYIEIAREAGSLGQGTQRNALFQNVSVIWVGLRAPREYMYARSDAWVARIMDGELQEEVTSLVMQGYADAPIFSGLIYKDALQLHRGEISQNEAITRMQRDVRRYIKRQMTWFSRNKDIAWYDVSEKSRSALADEIYTKVWLSNT